jgi:hypothetical protein
MEHSSYGTILTALFFFVPAQLALFRPASMGPGPICNC